MLAKERAKRRIMLNLAYERNHWQIQRHDTLIGIMWTFVGIMFINWGIYFTIHPEANNCWPTVGSCTIALICIVLLLLCPYRRDLGYSIRSYRDSQPRSWWGNQGRSDSQNIDTSNAQWIWSMRKFCKFQEVSGGSSGHQ